MTEEIELPDFLPNRYLSWYHLYMDVLQECIAAGTPINENTNIKIAYFGDDEEQMQFQQLFADGVTLYQQFPIQLIKARAFDYILAKLPNFETLNEIRERIMMNRYDEGLLRPLNNLIDICPTE